MGIFRQLQTFTRHFGRPSSAVFNFKNEFRLSLASGLWETVGMVTKKMRIPKKGDRVAVTGREGSYVVFLVDESLQVADLKQIGGDERLATIRWDTLAFLDDR